MSTRLFRIQSRFPRTLISVKLENYVKRSDMCRTNAQKSPNRFERTYPKRVRAPQDVSPQDVSLKGFQRNVHILTLLNYSNYTNSNALHSQHIRSRSTFPHLFYPQKNSCSNSYATLAQRLCSQPSLSQPYNVTPLLVPYFATLPTQPEKSLIVVVRPTAINPPWPSTLTLNPR